MNPPNEALDDEDCELEIARVREARWRISERFGHDLHKLVAYYIELEKTHPHPGGLPGPRHNSKC